jgi:hypothetical protein
MRTSEMSRMYAVCRGCGHQYLIREGDTHYEDPPPEWLRLRDFYYCSTECAFEARRLGLHYPPEAVLERSIYEIDSSESQVVVMGWGFR